MVFALTTMVVLTLTDDVRRMWGMEWSMGVLWKTCHPSMGLDYPNSIFRSKAAYYSYTYGIVYVVFEYTAVRIVTSAFDSVMFVRGIAISFSQLVGCKLKHKINMHLFM